MRNQFIASVVVAVVVTATASFGDTPIAQWDVQGSGTPAVTSLSAVSSDGFLAAVPALTRVGVTGAGAGNSFNSQGWNLTSTLVTNNDYITFTVAATTGYQLTLTSLDYAMNGSNTAPGTDQWGFSTDSGATWTMEPVFHVLNPAVTTSSRWDFADVSGVTTAQFRFWAYGATSITGGTSSGTGTTRIQNITGNDLTLNGSVIVIPEPSTLTLVGFGIVGMLAFARRRFSRS